MRGRTALVALALLVGCSGGEDPAEPGVVTTTTIVRTTAAEVPLSAGACGDVPRLQVGGALDPAAFVETTCEQPHTVEIGPVFDYPAGGDVDFPGADNVDGYATDECISRFADYVGTDYLTSIVDFLIVAPDEDGWDDGDRRIACILYRTDFEQLTVALEGSGI
jgi:hypothetical protein